jgi:SMI1 / KNR4 family (SUKH-1)
MKNLWITGVRWLKQTLRINSEVKSDVDPDARAVIDDLTNRLTAMAVDPPFRFLNTSKSDAEACVQRMTTFRGFSEQEIARAEKQLGVRFPTMFRAYLLMLGQARGQLLCDSKVAGVENFEEFRDDAIQLMSEAGLKESLPPNAVVFLFHQGYSFAYLVAEQTFDTPIYYFAEGDQKLAQIASSFAGFLQANVRRSEQTYKQIYGQGGYYLTIDGDYVTQTYPALSKGDRPLEKPLF